MRVSDFVNENENPELSCSKFGKFVALPICFIQINENIVYILEVINMVSAFTREISLKFSVLKKQRTYDHNFENEDLVKSARDLLGQLWSAIMNPSYNSLQLF